MKILKTILFYLSFFSFFSVLSQNKEVINQKNKPNILLILSDDHSYPHLGSYGDANVLKYQITPNLDAFAKEGMRFDRAYTSAPQCAPSRISMFTGSSPVSIDVSRFGEPARKEVDFFTDILKANGYWVGLDGRNHHLDGALEGKNNRIDEILKMGGMKNLDERFDHVAKNNTKKDNLFKVPQRIHSILDEVPQNKPFFLYFGFNQPHRMFDDDFEEINPNDLVLPPDFPDLPEIRKDYARYLSEVRDMDKGFGLIMEVLKKRGIDKNTIVIFMGDNGEALLRGKGTLAGRGIHVPLLVRWPNQIKENTVTSALVSGEDIAPTILDIVGLKFTKDITGISFLNTLKDYESETRSYVFAERGFHAGPLTRTDGLDLSRSVTSKKFHFVYNALPKQEFAQVDMVKTFAWEDLVNSYKSNKLKELHNRLYFYNERPVFELYDLENDPYELVNLYGDKKYKEIEETLRNEMEKKMLLDHDFLPLPSDVIQYNKKKNKGDE
ncbi:sulfatase [Polaribacter sp. BAL334]|uniref:sulfatase family protein n=1 Tax=Polaribacter sp. BAL334 TaxID=1708178 RepID=UPI0018D22073|nr:sulfatase [Polaribacter sp. BAL334]MBG7613122.1 sulfatase [Polaribacter sp. BAL334]